MIKNSLLILTLFLFGLQLRGQSIIKYSLNEPIFKMLYGGYAWDELVCDSIRLSSISDKEITILDTRSNGVIQIDSFDVVVFGKRGEVEEYYVKGNKFPNELQIILTNYVYNKSICIGSIFYFIDDKYLVYNNRDACLLTCKSGHPKEKK